MRRMRFSLFSKIMFWFFLNLLLLGAILFFIFNLDFRFAPQSRFFGGAPNGIEGVSRLIASETADATREERDVVLQKYSEVYNVEFFIFDQAGNQIAGKEKQLPEKVSTALKNAASAQNQQPFQSPFRRPANPNAPAENQQPQRDHPRMPMMPPPLMGRQALFFEKTDDPALYWFGSRTLIFERGQPEPRPVILLTASNSISGYGLFFDPSPWLVVGLVIFFVSTLFWLPFVRNITKNIGHLTEATVKISEEQFDVRVNEKRSDELGRLGKAINLLATRLSGFVHGQKRFLGDISHELNSPLARMQFALSILEDRVEQEHLVYVEDVKEEVELMSKLVAELLTYSKAGIKAPDIKLENVRLLPIIERVVERETAQENAEVKIDVDENLAVLAQSELLSRAIGNIIRNAVRYAGNTGAISIRADQHDDHQVKITITDNGAGVPEAELEKLFDPFYRVQTDRARQSGGSGLGLAIVKTCIEVCHGKVFARNRTPSGLEVTILLTQPT